MLFDIVIVFIFSFRLNENQQIPNLAFSFSYVYFFLIKIFQKVTLVLYETITDLICFLQVLMYFYHLNQMCEWSVT